MGIISITSCQGLPMRDLIPLSTDKWLTNNWPMTDRYCAISYQFFWLESLFLVILDCKSILVLLIYWFYEIFPSISIFNNVFILFFRCCCNKYVTGVRLNFDGRTLTDSPKLFGALFARPHFIARLPFRVSPSVNSKPTTSRPTWRRPKSWCCIRTKTPSSVIS